MANFAIIVDPDRERRSRFIETTAPLLPPIDGLNITSWTCNDLGAIWASGKATPVSQSSDEQGGAIIWGDALYGDAPERVPATRLRHLWRDPDRQLPPALDGFHAAIVYDANRGVIAGGDLLGLFPIYYYTTENILLIGSSPELFRHHPTFRATLNPAGLVGILLTMHIFDGQTLLSDVRRLAAGHLLSWQPEKGPREIQQYHLPVSTRYFDLPFSAHLNLLEQALDEAIESHTTGEGPYTLLLSGGLDSRLLGGYLRQRGGAASAMTLGLSTDIEMKCAVRVAQTLGFEHRTTNPASAQYPLYAALQARWEHVANGFNNIMNWGVCRPLQQFAARVVTGHLMDSIVGGSHIGWAYSNADQAPAFDTFFARMNQWGVRPETLQRLLRREVFGDLVSQTMARLRAVYESYGKLESQRAWSFDLHHRQRFHVGGAAWALSFGAWPVLPAASQTVLETAGGLPAATLAERRAQIELLCRRFPELAALPLDRNAYNVEPLRPRLRHLLVRNLARRLRPLDRLNPLRPRRRSERRYYYRIYDFNGPGWVAVRRQAESQRERALHFFNREVLEEILPPPEVPLQFRDGIVEASGLKSLLGFLIWLQDHL